MPDLWERQISRRDLLAGAATVGLGAALAACAPPGTKSAAPSPSSNGGKSELRILLWSHFVPQFDTWFDGWAKDWGQKNGIPTTVDHVNLYDLPARVAAEVAARSGHDLVQFTGQVLTHIYEKDLLDMGDLVDYAVKKYGPMDQASHMLGQVSGRWVAWPDFYINQPLLMRTDLLQQAGVDPSSIKSWNDVLSAGKKLKAGGHPGGFAISHCNDANHNWRTVMWSFGASEVAKDGKTVTVDSSHMRDFLAFAQELYQTALYPDVFAWQDVSDNQWLDSGSGGFIHDAISALRSVQGKVINGTDIYTNTRIYAPLTSNAHPAGFEMPDYNAFSIWNFSPNQEAAREFVRYYIDNYLLTFQQSLLYNSPTHPDLYKKRLFTDATVGGQAASDKFAVLDQYSGSKVATFGYPGPPNYGANLVLSNYVIPDMVQMAARTPTKQGIESAIQFGESQVKNYYTQSP